MGRINVTSNIFEGRKPQPYLPNICAAKSMYSAASMVAWHGAECAKSGTCVLHPEKGLFVRAANRCVGTYVKLAASVAIDCTCTGSLLQ